MSGRFSTKPPISVTNSPDPAPGKQISGNPCHRLEVLRPHLPVPLLLQSSRQNSPYWIRPFLSQAQIHSTLNCSTQLHSGRDFWVGRGMGGGYKKYVRRHFTNLKMCSSFFSAKLLSDHTRGLVLPPRRPWSRPGYWTKSSSAQLQTYRSLSSGCHCLDQPSSTSSTSWYESCNIYCPACLHPTTLLKGSPLVL